MKTFQFISLLLLSLVLVAGCASHKKNVNLSPGATEKIMDNIPSWYKAPPDNTDTFVYGRGTNVSRDLQIAVDGASEAGRLEIARTMEVRFQGMTKRFSEETGLAEDSELLKEFSQTTKSVVSQVMVGSTTDKNEVINENGLFRIYALMKLPLGEANTALMNQIKANQNMYTRFRAAQAFEDLQKDCDAYETWKAQQAQGH
jgi:hypothetical protein